jgi:tetratricopeptide (TPR) repeat protein
MMLQKDKITNLIRHGLFFHQQGKLKEAEVLYEQVLRISPNNFDALNFYGVLLAQKKSFLQSLKFLTKASKVNPNNPLCLNNLGITLRELKRFDEALLVFKKAIDIDPYFAEPYSNKGRVLHELKKYEEAILNFDKAIDLRVKSPEPYSNKGISLKALSRFDEALINFNKAISIKPDYFEAYYNRGVIMQELNNLREAFINYHQALKIKPDYADANWNLSLCQLLVGDFIPGFKGYEWRWKVQDHNKGIVGRYFSQPLWLGVEPLKDKTILLYAEQGLGDTIQFCRYVSLVVQLGAKVILEVQGPLVKLLQNLAGVSQVIATGDKLPEFDYQCPLLSLPLAFGTEIKSIPPVVSHIVIDNETLTKWKIILGEKTKIRIGIVWSGSTSHKNDHNRSLNLAQLLPYLPSNVEYVCLQKEVRKVDRVLLGENTQIKYFGDELRDFTDTAALCNLMDLVISVDTSVAHLAGTLGKLTWVMLPFSPDWRWLLDRDDSLWYPSVKIYRQDKIGDWNSLLLKIKKDLDDLDGKINKN